MLERQEDSLFKSRLRDHLAQQLVLFLLIFLADARNPGHKGLSFGT